MKVTGSLQQKGSVYYAVLRVPTDKGGFKQKWESTKIKAGGKSPREEKANLAKANKILQQKILQYENQSVLQSDESFLAYIAEWLERKKASLKLNSYEAYSSYLKNHIAPFFEPLKLKINDVTPRHIQRYIDTKMKDGLNSNSVRRHFVILNGALDEALRFCLVPFNPCDRITLPKKNKFVGKAYSSEEASKLLSCIAGDPIEPAVMLGLYLGLRRSEALGLRWQDVDFESDTVKIRNTVVKTYTLIEAEQTKSAASKRDMHMTDTLKKYLLKLKRKQIEERLALGAEYVVNDHVCIWPDGRLLSPDYVSHHFATLLQKKGLPPLRFHELRHTAGSLLINGGQSIKSVQEYLGHEKASTTLDIYAHLVSDAHKESATQLEGILKAEVG